MLLNTIRFFIVIIIVLINFTHSNKNESIVLTTPSYLIEVPQIPTRELKDDSFHIRFNPSIELINKNKDYVGWIQIENTVIDYPILKGPDNDFYLSRNFEQQPTDAGSIFMDYRNFGFGFDQHTIVYGHNMKNDSMFGQLDLYLDSSFALSNPIIYIQDLYGLRKYQVFSSYYATADVDLIQTDLSTIDTEHFYSKLIEKSGIDYDLYPNTSDRILSLVTCNYDVNDGRLFVHAFEIIDL